MPKISKTQTIETAFPSIEGSKVWVKKDLSMGEIEEIYGKEYGDITVALKVVTVLIQEWNIQDENGNKLEISEKNIKQLSQNDILTVLQKTDFTQNQDFTSAEKQK